MTQHRIFGAFTKVEKRPDGTLYIEGVASSEARDSQGEIVKAAAMRKAIPSYLREDGTGPLREMHQLVAAGKTTAMWVDDATGKTHVACLVVDSEAVKKVEHGVYQGFSIGGGVVKRDPLDRSIIDELALSELSLVDRGANPEAVFTLVKIDAPAPAEVQTSAAAPAAEPAAPAPTVRKGMYQIACAADLLGNLAALQQDTAWEAAAEGDASALPAKLKSLAAELAACLVQMDGEETAELVAALPTVTPAPVVAMADKPTDVAKVAEPTEREALAKILADATERLAKLDAPVLDVEALQKRAIDAETAAAGAGEALKKVLDERDTLAKALAEAEVKLKTKGSLKIVAVSKADDARGAGKEEPVAPPENTVERALFDIKKAHASGGTPLIR